MKNNKLKNCKVCGEEVAKSARICPHCGAKLKKGHPILTSILVLVVLVAVIGSSSNNDEPKRVETSAPAQSVEAAPQKGTETPSQDSGSIPSQPPEKEEKSAFYAGETVEMKGINVTLVSVTESEGSAFNAPTDGNVFVLCEFEIANNSAKEIAISSMLSFEAYCDDYTCTFSLGALMEKGSKNQLDGTVAAGKKFNGIIGYEVPTDWKELEIIFTPDFWTGKDITFIATNN